MAEAEYVQAEEYKGDVNAVIVRAEKLHLLGLQLAGFEYWGVACAAQALQHGKVICQGAGEEGDEGHPKQRRQQ
jgi:hypothetical protein